MESNIRIFHDELLGDHKSFKKTFFIYGKKLWNHFKYEGLVSHEIEKNLNIVED
jgi:hypothetical protein